MKECPKCHTQYDDTMSFCTKDGCRLRDVGKEVVVTDSQPVKQKRKGGCLKKIIIAVVLLIIAAVAVYNHMMNAATYLRVEPNIIRMPKAGGECNVDIDYDGYVWKINHEPEWVTVSEFNDHFTLTVEPNTTGQDREGSITVQSGKLIAQVVIGQLGFATKLKVDKYSLKFPSEGGNDMLTIDTDGCDLNEDCPDWISVDSDTDGELSIKCNANDDEYRTGTIKLSEDDVSQTISVTQGGICNVCHGKGEKSCSYCLGMGGSGFGFYYSTCMWCGGKGKIECSACDGTGKRE